MPLSLQVQCPARVHLFLSNGRRAAAKPAAFCAKINLFDVLDAEELGTPGFEFEALDEAGEPRPDRGEPVRRAAEAFCREFGFGEGVRFRLTKKIPDWAGLGCDASDAAGALLALARIHRLRPGRSLSARLRRVGAGLGRDVPFFLEPGTFGDLRKGPSGTFSPMDGGRPLPWMVVVVPGCAGGPAPAPNLTTRLHLDKLDKLKKKIEKGRPIPEWEGLLYNCLEEAVLDFHPEARQAKSILARLGLRGVHVSGSGCAVHGFVPSHGEGERVFRLLKGYPWKVFLTCCLG